VHVDYVYVQIHDKETYMRADSSNMPGMPWLGSRNNNLLCAHVFVSIDLCVHGFSSQRLSCKNIASCLYGAHGSSCKKSKSKKSKSKEPKHTIGIVISRGVVVGSRTTATTIIADYYCGILLEMRKGCSVCGIGQNVGEGKLEQVPISTTCSTEDILVLKTNRLRNSLIK
jgi:hypothetical protein